MKCKCKKCIYDAQKDLCLRCTAKFSGNGKMGIIECMMSRPSDDTSDNPYTQLVSLREKE